MNTLLLSQTSEIRWLRANQCSIALAAILVSSIVACGKRPEDQLVPKSSSPAASGEFHMAGVMCRRLDSLAKVDTTPNVSAAYKDLSIDCHRRLRPIPHLAAEGKRLMEIHWSIPEYHDEQRLRSGTNGFGPVAFFYSLPQYGTYTGAMQIEAQGTLGTLVGVVFVDTATNAGLPESYGRLKLKPGLNCLWLARSQSADPNDGWAAYVAQATNERCDRLVVEQDLPSSKLFVHRTPLANKGLYDYPAVARFIDGTVPMPPQGAPNVPPPPQGVPAGQGEPQPLLGVKCLDGWCEIGPQGFSIVPPFWATQTHANERAIEGWYDAQWLAVKKGNAFVKGPRARITPAPKVNELPTAAFNQMQLVAEISLDDDPAADTKYYSWGLRRGDQRLFVQRDASGDWRAQLVHKLPGADSWNEVSRRDWIITMRTSHYDEAVPGTARFRWTDHNTDGIWIPCGQACCQAQGPIT